jgi:hypothetical protein
MDKAYGWLIDWLIDYLRFYVLLKNFSLIWGRDHCRWRAAKFRPMLGAQGLWAGRDLYRATPAVTRDLGLSDLIRRTAPYSRLLRHTRGCEGSILISNPDPQGEINTCKIIWQITGPSIFNLPELGLIFSPFQNQESVHLSQFTNEKFPTQPPFELGE